VGRDATTSTWVVRRDPFTHLSHPPPPVTGPAAYRRTKPCSETFSARSEPQVSNVLGSKRSSETGAAVWSMSDAAECQQPRGYEGRRQSIRALAFDVTDADEGQCGRLSSSDIYGRVDLLVRIFVVDISAFGSFSDGRLPWDAVAGAGHRCNAPHRWGQWADE
jgi:hypothetical protein